ncbi:MAG: O-antigen ligase family protein [Holophagales bacterium]|nr:O-antigen ligase family protein [Holophagales bacterium]MBK9967089.1 O-antigen ligase family protein [Holophagales bacterium]
MAIVALIPGFLAAYWVSRYGVVRAFLDVYLPVLLVFPDYFRFFMPGLPDPTMNQAAILPIAAGFFAKELRGWKFSTGDVLVLLFAYMCAYSEYRAKNYSEAQNLMFDMLTNVVLPYILTKGLVEAKGHRLEFAKRFVFLMTIVAFMMPYETKMTTVLIRIPLNPFFPGQGNWTPTGRWGLIRAAGPYGHAILAGIMMCVAYRFQRWLEWSGGWTGKVKLPGLTLPRGKFYTLAMLAGSILTLVKGPWVGAFAGGAIVMALKAKNRKAVGGALLGLLVCIGIPFFIWFWNWAGVGRANALTVSQETAAYRKELIEAYLSVAARHAMWGWGRAGWPKVGGFESTDNHYLLLALNHGLVALFFFFAIQFRLIARLIRFGLRRVRTDPSALLAFNLAGAIFVFLVSLATVYHGQQTVHLFFITAGWAEGLLCYRNSDGQPGGEAVALVPAPAHGFRRVVT